MPFVLDTNVYIEIERDNQKIINEILKLNEPDIFYITAPSYSEIHFGLLKGRKEELKNKLERLDKFPVLNTTKNSSILFSEIKHSLEKKGDIIPLFDILIASIVIDNNLTLITTDEHFKRIPGLKTIVLNL